MGLRHVQSPALAFAAGFSCSWGGGVVPIKQAYARDDRFSS